MLGLWLGVQRGTYQEVDELWLRWIDDDRRALPIDTEQAVERRAKVAEERAKGEQAESREQQARTRVRIAARALLATGQSPSEVASLLGVSVDGLGK